MTLNILIFLPKDGSAFKSHLPDLYLIPGCDQCNSGIDKNRVQNFNK
ncbi:hypothetical protein NIES2104_45060 [Leptolyngbya sp. NIES-2104]|nr:hypothetical protein NIES2104_45060 [Leptolyngbya sp. NIES-2104]